MWQAGQQQPKERIILWLMKQPAKSRSKRVAVGRKKTPIRMRPAVAAGISSTLAGETARETTSTAIGVGSHAGGAVR
jgi:hypothetical protein